MIQPHDSNSKGVNRMIQVPIEEFKRSMNHMVQELPVEVTKRGKILFICYGPEGKPESVKSIVGSPGDTIYEPDPVKQPKQSASKQAQPIVNAMLSGISKRPLVPHHPRCMCAVCKDAA